MRTAIYNAPTGEDVPVVIEVGTGVVGDEYYVRVSEPTGLRDYPKGKGFYVIPRRLTNIKDDGRTQPWVCNKGRGNAVMYSVDVPGIGKITVKRLPISSGGAWRATWPDSRHGSTAALAHACMAATEVQIQNRLSGAVS